VSGTWPGGYRRAMHQHEHEAWNASHYPGTRQICSMCEQPTGRCEEDTIFHPVTEQPICHDCLDPTYWSLPTPPTEAV